MPTIDVQVHAYERNHPGRPWVGHLAGPASVTGDEMVSAMDAVGVDGALLVSPFSLYRYDASYALEVYAAHPGRFGLIKPVDTTDPHVAETIADWAATSGTVGVRIMLNQDVSTDPADAGINRALAAAARQSLPVNLLCSGRLDQAAGLAARNPDTVLVIDHLGLQQPFHPPPPAAAVGRSAEGAGPGRANRMSGSRSAGPARCPTSRSRTATSGTRSCGIIDAFSLDRCMWGTDWTRATGLLTYKEGVEAFRVTKRLSDS